MPLIAPSLLNSNQARVIETLNDLVRCNIKILHIDVMDGDFVPDLGIGKKQLSDIRSVTKLLLDVHLMINQPERHFMDFINNGGDIITFHIETTNNAFFLIQEIKKANKKVGVALNPSTPIEAIEHLLAYIDLVLLMSINPGRKNDYFIMETLKKIEKLDNYRKYNNQSFMIEVDGKIDDNTLKNNELKKVDIYVVGGFIFNSNNTIEMQLKKLEKLIEEV